MGVRADVLLQAPLFSSDPPWYSNKFLLEVSIVKFARITSTVCDLAMMASVFDSLKCLAFPYTLGHGNLHGNPSLFLCVQEGANFPTSIFQKWFDSSTNFFFPMKVWCFELHLASFF